mmetsp:Transcript_66929/g.145429  ORF Transcript_66929/g.145429 Transcript_66929/m.145429 type:complete len:341 (-) Transcript_66929:149-1171(-)
MEGNLWQHPDVVAKSTCKCIQNKPGLVQEEDREHNEDGENHGELRQEGDTFFETHHDTADSTSGNDDNEDALGRLIDLQAEAASAVRPAFVAAENRPALVSAFVQADEGLVDLNGTQSQVCADAEDGAEDRQDLDDVTKGAIHQLSDDRIECEAHRHGKSAAVSHETDQDAHEDISNPPVQPPMEPGLHDGLLCPRVVVPHVLVGPSGSAVPLVVPHRLRRVVPQASSNTAREEHRKVGEVAEFGLVVRVTEFDVVVLVQYVHQYKKPHVARAHVEPVPDFCDPCLRSLGFFSNLFLPQCSRYYESPDEKTCQAGDHRIAVEAATLGSNACHFVKMFILA